MHTEQILSFKPANRTTVVSMLGEDHKVSYVGFESGDYMRVAMAFVPINGLDPSGLCACIVESGRNNATHSTIARARSEVAAIC